MNTKKIIFFGNERLATGITTECLTIKKLISAGFDICAIITSYDQPTTRSSRKLEIKQIAEENNIPILMPNDLEVIHDQINSYQADIGVLVAYGQKVPKSIIDIFPRGIINLHPSLLPRHRGPTPIESAILNGDTETGVSIMSLATKMDSGPIYGYSHLKLTGTETKASLAEKMLDIGSEMIVNLLPDILDDSIVAEQQNESLSTYDSLIVKKSGELDFNKKSSQLEREIRAYSGWPKSFTKLKNIDVIITKASIAKMTGLPGDLLINKDELIIFCKEYALSIEKLQPSGKKEMTAKEFLAGYSSKLQ